MLSIYDDLALHQTPATLDQPASSDPAAYERYYFGFFSDDGTAAVGLTVNVHPNKGLIDAAFAVSGAGRHESLMSSDHLGHDRADLTCGDIRLTLEDPMRSLRITVTGPDITADLRFAATTPAIEESRVTRYRANRVVQDRSRYVQLGTITGHVTSPLGEWNLDDQPWRGGRDHSWGIWDAPRQHASESKNASPSFFWLIGTFDDWALQAVTHENADGETYGEYAAVCPTLAAGAEPAGPGARQQAHPVTGLDVTFPDRGWHFTDAHLTLGAAQVGDLEHVEMESVHTLLPRAIGYGHPTWISGDVPDELPTSSRDSWTLDDEDLDERINHRGLQAVRLTRADGAVGFGVVDQCVSVSRAQRTS